MNEKNMHDLTSYKVFLEILSTPVLVFYATLKMLKNSVRYQGPISKWNYEYKKSY